MKTNVTEGMQAGTVIPLKSEPRKGRTHLAPEGAKAPIKATRSQFSPSASGVTFVADVTLPGCIVAGYIRRGHLDGKYNYASVTSAGKTLYVGPDEHDALRAFNACIPDPVEREGEGIQGYTMAIAISGIASMVTQLEVTGANKDVDPDARARIKDECRQIAKQGRALLDRLGKLVRDAQ